MALKPERLLFGIFSAPYRGKWGGLFGLSIIGSMSGNILVPPGWCETICAPALFAQNYDPRTRMWLF